MPRSSKLSSFLKFPYKYPVCSFLPSQACYMPCQFHSPWPVHTNNIWRKQIMKTRSIGFAAADCHVLAFGSKNFWHSVHRFCPSVRVKNNYTRECRDVEGYDRLMCITRWWACPEFNIYLNCPAVQVVRSRVRSPMVLLQFFNDIILPAALWPCGRLSVEQKWVPGIFSGGVKAAGA